MNAPLIHLASIECWQRAKRLGLAPLAFIILQIIAASTAKHGMRKSTIDKESRLAAASTQKHLTLLIRLQLVRREKMPGASLSGPIPQGYLLSDKGRELMTPQARASEAATERSAS